MMVTMGGPPGAGAGAGAGAPGAGAGAAVPLCVTFTCLYHQPLPGVCAYTDRVFPPDGSCVPLTTALKPDAAQKGLPSAAATSGRFCATRACASIVPPPSMVPFQTWTASAPAQPSA